ncbi:P27 family phage terminase small subunit [Streptosporangium sandarakinum]|uniref:P27 family phage terminase small subunit n=1 Tax=Streptosporangium sandarakinum TaxID=1260955 RepID=UPI00371158D7
MQERKPADLGEAGSALWDRLTDELVFDCWEAEILAAACRQRDDIALLERVIASEGVITTGSQGQPRLSAVVTEVRQSRLALAKLLAELRLPSDDDDGKAMNGASRRAQAAANTRWARKRREAEPHGA